MVSEVTIDDEGEDVDMDWNSAHEFVTPTISKASVTLTSASSDTGSHLSTSASCKGTGAKRERLKSLKNKAINALRHSVEGIGTSGGAGRSGSESPRSDSLIARMPALLAHPRTALKASLTHIVAGKLSTLNAPYIPQNAEVEFVEAHEERDEARENKCQGDIEDAERKIGELVWRRRNMQVNWAMERHVTSVAVAPTHRREWPKKEDFFVKDGTGKTLREGDGSEKVEYIKWLGQVCFLVFCIPQFQIELLYFSTIRVN